MIFIQCDICDEFLTDFADAADPRMSAEEVEDDYPNAAAHDLRLTAEDHGWTALKDSTVHYCPSCCKS